ncbi:FecR family protein [Winogradskyella luteola]|uniref:FecR domain-containing protein n=1 Tax=Winogradskyella luteola TaxID=2828330 RepID=A0A9X1JNU7_9FLAO|nr:FecR domain-containing protein [Winogradskyella luteola]MBV7270010.1 FecR domain-containing protein [Winogradskyella luteola]
MKREELIKKWLDNNLNAKELKAFEQLQDYNELIQMNSALKSFKAPEFSVENSYENLKPKLKHINSNNWLKPILRIAAMLAICFSVYYYSTGSDTEINTQIAQSTKVNLPDTSIVHLNANSTLSFNERSWDNNREVQLNGEAFFKVAKGQVFDVLTTSGTVSVLGTQFNVKQRNDYFEVTCYEGLVAVTHNGESVKLHPGDTFRKIDGKLITTEKEIVTRPTWLRGESSFKTVPLILVIAELENQYGIKILAPKIDTQRLFTGSFTHKNLDLALQSVTIPLNLSYSKSGNSIVLKRE